MRFAFHGRRFTSSTSCQCSTTLQEQLPRPVPLTVLAPLAVPQVPLPNIKSVDEAVIALKTTSLHASMVTKLNPSNTEAVLDLFQVEISANVSVAHALAELVRLKVVTSAEQLDEMKPVFVFLCLCCMRNPSTGINKFTVAEVIHYHNYTSSY